MTTGAPVGRRLLLAGILVSSAHAEQALEPVDDVVDDLVVVLLILEVAAHHRKRLADDRQEHGLHSDEDDGDEKEEEDRPEDRLRDLQRVEVEVAESHAEERLDRVDKAGVGRQHAAEQQVRQLREGEEVDEERDDEGFHVLGGQFDGVGQHAHASVELQHVDELESRQEDDQRHDEAVRLVPDADRHEVDVLACRNASTDACSSNRPEPAAFALSDLCVHSTFLSAALRMLNTKRLKANSAGRVVLAPSGEPLRIVRLSGFIRDFPWQIKSEPENVIITTNLYRDHQPMF